MESVIGYKKYSVRGCILWMWSCSCLSAVACWLLGLRWTMRLGPCQGTRILTILISPRGWTRRMNIHLSSAKSARTRITCRFSMYLRGFIHCLLSGFPSRFACFVSLGPDKYHYGSVAVWLLMSFWLENVSYLFVWRINIFHFL